MNMVFITGANKGIGLETAHQLLKNGHYVFLGARNVKNGKEAIMALKKKGLTNVELITIDVNNDKSVKEAREAIGKKTDMLDVLVNNAGILGEIPQTATGTSIENFKNVFETNLFGVIRTTQVFIDLLKNAPNPRIVNVTSSLGSLSLHTNPDWVSYNQKIPAYLCSKAALNMYTINLAYELNDPKFKVNAVDPGYTDTDFTDHKGPGNVEDAGKRIAKYAMIGDDGPTGAFISEITNPETGEIPW